MVSQAILPLDQPHNPLFDLWQKCHLTKECSRFVRLSLAFAPKMLIFFVQDLGELRPQRSVARPEPASAGFLLSAAGAL
jgi:hypothetical protein